MGTSKILIDGAGIDLTSDTVTAAVLRTGYTAHDANGDKVTGTYAGIVPSGTKSITTTAETDVAAYSKAQIVDANLKAANIASGVTVLGIAGTHSGGLALPGVETYHTTFTGDGGGGTAKTFAYTLSSTSFVDGVILFTADNINSVGGGGIIYACIDLGQSSPSPIKATVVNFAGPKGRCYNNRQLTNISVSASQVTFTLPSNAEFTSGVKYHLTVCRYT